MADDEIAVTIEDDTGTPAEGTETGGVTAEPVDELKAQVAELKASRQRESDRAANAERAAALARNQAQEAAARADTVTKQATEREGDAIGAGISAANAAIEAAKKEIKNAGEAGDHGAQADAYDRLAQARADLAMLNRQKADVEIKKAEAARPRQEASREVTRDAPVDEFEQMLANMAQSGAGRSADWIRKNRDAWADKKKNARIRAAHFEADAEGIELESDAYFKFVEERAGLREAEKPAGDKRVEVKTHSRRPPVAPVGEAAGGGMNGGSGTTVRLTAGQAKAATDGTLVWNYDDSSGKNRFKKGDPIGVQEMARRVHEQTKQGLYDPNNINA